ncbi:MAG: hydroxymethylglutaryl-CoA lyase [Desulfobacterales bacterium]|nr:hydroxymethylglutaryl-CoA lyase [Desulfobacterales bacterium]MDX2509008.1 hydroxymethylglutaryl-CoA lyase [Desulfobacterales bacterium]
MHLNLPDKVTLIEVGPRDGFQFETKIVPTLLKAEIISGLVDAGLKDIQATSFVHPDVVPQMADAEDLLKRLPKRNDVRYSALVLNEKGVERAHLSGLQHIEISISASDTHSRKNAGMPFQKALEKGKDMIRLAQEYNMEIRAGIQCAFGCVYEGRISEERVLKIAKDFLEIGIQTLAISDTTGMADPLLIKNLLKKLIPKIGNTPVVFHLHDTRGLGLVNVMAAMECGVTRFDTALAGMGGCPFVSGAAGNIATEDTAWLMKSLNIETGVNISKVAKCSQKLEKFFEKKFPGKMHRLIR